MKSSGSKPAKSGKSVKSVKSAGYKTPFQRLQQQLSVVDVLFELRDARVPVASRHPQAKEIFGHKTRIVILSKADLVSPAALERWVEQVAAAENCVVCPTSIHDKSMRKHLIAEALRLTAAKREQLAKKGLLPRPLRACVVGLPNVGKSSLINRLIGKHKAQTGDAPGITKGTQWVRVDPALELLDTPGILPPANFSRNATLKLALCNILPADKYDAEEVARHVLSFVAQHHRQGLKVYGSEFAGLSEPGLEELALARNCLSQKGRPDIRRAAAIALGDFRDGTLGRFVLDVLDTAPTQAGGRP